MLADFLLGHSADTAMLAMLVVQLCALVGVLGLAYLGYTSRDADIDAMRTSRRVHRSPPRRSPRIARRRAAK